METYRHNDLRELWWESIKAEVLIDRDAFMVFAQTWEVEPVMIGDELFGAVIRKGNEYHFLKAGAHQWTRQILRSLLRKGMMTRIEPDDTEARDFARRLGFNFVGEDENGDYHYKLERLRYV